jgi:hypothetical protein
VAGREVSRGQGGAQRPYPVDDRGRVPETGTLCLIA